MIGICSRRTNVKSFDPCVEVSVCWNRYGNATGGARQSINQSINQCSQCQKEKTFLPCCQWERIVSRRTIRLCQTGSVCRAVECLSVRACITCKIPKYNALHAGSCTVRSTNQVLAPYDVEQCRCVQWKHDAQNIWHLMNANCMHVWTLMVSMIMRRVGSSVNI